jgi:hypothetical protein
MALLTTACPSAELSLTAGVRKVGYLRTQGIHHAYEVLLGCNHALAAPLLAQSDAVRPYQLSERAHAVVERLATLNAIDAQDWQYHEGPVERGESLDLKPLTGKPYTSRFTRLVRRSGFVTGLRYRRP